MFTTECETTETVQKTRKAAVVTTVTTKVITPNEVSFEAVEAWVKEKAVDDDGQWVMDEEPIGYQFHDTLEDLTAWAVACLEAVGVRVFAKP